VLLLFLSDRDAERYTEFVHNGGFRIIGLVIAWYMMDIVLSPMQALALNILYPGAGYH
jgi:hypothetical protein